MKNKTITYFVNGEEEQTDDRVLTVRQILEGAEFVPVTNYTLKSENPPADYGVDYDQEIKVHPNQRFQALFVGPTPVS